MELENNIRHTQLYNGSVLTINDYNTKQRVFEIEESPFFIEHHNYRFYFSSRFYMKNFLEKLNDTLDKTVERITHFLPAKEETDIDGLELLNLFHLYSLIEKRGVRIIDGKGVEIKCLTQIKVNVHFSNE